MEDETSTSRIVENRGPRVQGVEEMQNTECGIRRSEGERQGFEARRPKPEARIAVSHESRITVRFSELIGRRNEFDQERFGKASPQGVQELPLPGEDVGLARHYARPGAVLGLVARRGKMLQDLAADL